MVTRAVAPLLIAAAFGVLVVGCSGQSPVPPPREEPLPREQAPVEPRDRVERLLARAEHAAAADAAGLRLDAVQLLERRGEWSRAAQVLALVPAERLRPDDTARRALLAARQELAQGRADEALQELSAAPSPGSATELPRRLQVDLGMARADVLLALDRALEAARERAALQSWLSDDTQRRDNARAILRALTEVPLGLVEASSATASSEDWRGWLELSADVRDVRVSPEAQLARLQAWEQRYGSLSALEAGLEDLAPAVRERIRQPARVALLLPLSGKAGPGGQAVLQGYLAEYYGTYAAEDSRPPVAVIDTASFPGGFAAAYRHVVGDGAALVIGPLLREELEEFGRGLEPTVPTLALNFLEAPLPRHPLLYQFGIDTGEEIAQLVASAGHAGYRRALALAEDTPRARRLATEFGRLWQADGFELLDTLWLDDLNDYRDQLEERLLLGQSRERARQLSRLLGLPLETEPRRRQDLDLVTVFAAPVAARSIRSLLSFLYAGDIPVWGTSQSFSGTQAPEENIDLESLRFADMPWFSAAEAPLREAARGSVPAGEPERLLALGVDSCRLQARLGLLDAPFLAGLEGATGELRAGENGRIRRQASWYRFHDGHAVPEHPLGPPPPAAPVVTSMEGEQTWQEPPDQGAADALPKTEP